MGRKVNKAAVPNKAIIEIVKNASEMENYTNEKAAHALESQVNLSSNVSEYINQRMITTSEKEPLNINDLHARNVRIDFDYNTTALNADLLIYSTSITTN